MDTIFIVTLVIHVIAGLVGFIATYAVLMSLCKRESSLGFLKISSAIAFIAYLTSWFTGGYYYVFQYGLEVKPVIKGGDNAWAHSFFMEAKEHVFLLLPVLTFVLALVFFLRGKDVLLKGKPKSAVMLLTVLTALLALFITASGILISGSAG